AGALASDAVAADPVLSALAEAVPHSWEGPSSDLLARLEDTLPDGRPPKDWPKSARSLTALLKRRAPSLRRLGWTVEQAEKHTEGGKPWRLSPPDENLTKPLTNDSD